MPTARFYSFLAASLAFYFFANQTQIGWLYVVSALLCGILLAGFVFNRRAARGIKIRRLLHMTADLPVHENDDLSITLSVDNLRRTMALQLRIEEKCPLAIPESPEADISIFTPVLSRTVSFEYAVTVYRRGLHNFPPSRIQTRFPFGFFQRISTIPADTAVLVYPEVRKLSHFALLDQRPMAQLTHPRAGLGTEIIGVRDYRPGDSPRHIHWRTVARRARLVSKEFAEETQPGVTIVLDRFMPPEYSSTSKHTPFEIAIKCAVSMAEYALRKQYPVSLAADETDFAVPQGSLVWDSIMQYTARVASRPVSTLEDVLRYQAMQQFIAVVLSWPDDNLLEILLSLKQRGYRLFVAIPDPASFPIETNISAQKMMAACKQAEIDTCMIQHGDDWAEKISQSSAQFINNP